MRSMLILNILLLSLSWSARASNACHDLHDSLIEIERKLHAATLHNCGQLTPETLGLPPLDEDMRSVFDKSRCQNFASLDLELSASETELVLLDSLSDLREQAVEHSQTLRDTSNWSARQNALAQSLTKDVTLGAAIQHAIEHPQLAELFGVETRGPQWRTRLEQFCEGRTARSAAPFCGIWIQHGPRSASKALEANDLYAFLDDLRPLLNSERRLDDSRKRELLAQLQLRAGDAPTDFKTFQEKLAAAEFYQFNAPRPPVSLSDAQVKLLRQEALQVPVADALPNLSRMLGRVEHTKRLLQLKNAQELLKTTLKDSSARQEARLKARWASLSQALAPATPVKCTDAPPSELRGCIQNAFDELRPQSRIPVTAQQDSLAQSLLLGAELAARVRHRADRCSQDDVLRAMVQAEAVPQECEQAGAGARPQLELRRQLHLALRDRLRLQEETAMRFRSFAFDEMRRRDCHSINAAGGQHEASPYCQGLPGKIAFGPAVNLAHDTMAIFFEGLRSQSELSTADCPAGEQGIYVRICNLAFNRRPAHAGPGATTAPYRGTPAALSTDAPRRERDPIVRESLVNAVSDIANTWLDVRMRNLRTTPNTLQMPPVRMMPYSQPMTMSLSDYVMTTATVYGGYGRYYQCPSCGVGSGSAFNSYWGVSGSAPVAGMSGTGLQGTALSSRFFGAASSGAGASAGFFSF